MNAEWFHEAYGSNREVCFFDTVNLHCGSATCGQIWCGIAIHRWGTIRWGYCLMRFGWECGVVWLTRQGLLDAAWFHTGMFEYCGAVWCGTVLWHPVSPVQFTHGASPCRYGEGPRGPWPLLCAKNYIWNNEQKKNSTLRVLRFALHRVSYVPGTKSHKVEVMAFWTSEFHANGNYERSVKSSWAWLVRAPTGKAIWLYPYFIPRLHDIGNKGYEIYKPLLKVLPGTTGLKSSSSGDGVAFDPLFRNYYTSFSRQENNLFVLTGVASFGPSYIPEAINNGKKFSVVMYLA